MHIVTILKAARVRIDVGVFAPTICVCSRGKGLKGPHGPDEAWCWCCAIEASQITGGFRPDCYGLAMSELAFDILGKQFSAKDWIERDAALNAWGDHLSKADVTAAFDRTIARLEREDRG